MSEKGVVGVATPPHLQEWYTSPPPFVVNTLMRWMLTDPAYQKQFLRYLSRAIDPNSFTFGPMPGPMVRGFLRDVFKVRI